MIKVFRCSSMPKLCKSYRLYVFIICFGILMYIFGNNERSYDNILYMPRSDLYDIINSENMPEKATKKETNLPLEFVEKNNNLLSKMFYKNSSCALFPKLYDLEYSNIYWQLFKANDTSFHLYSAHYDTRKLNGLRNSVQIVSMLDNHNFTQEIYCQFWFENKSEPVITKTNKFAYIWYVEWGIHLKGTLGPYIVTCQLPDAEQLPPPKCVSLAENYCDRATNLLKVTYDVLEKKEDFAVCVKGLDFPDLDISIRLVEWLEFMHLMGAHKVFLYNLQTHPNVEKVLQYYTAIGRVEVTELTLPGKQPNLPFLQHDYLTNNIGQKRYDELIPYNDCFYRNMNSHKYIVILDLDEVIIPVMDVNWSELMQRVLSSIPNNRSYASYNARNVYFLDDMTPKDLNTNIPSYMHMVKHTFRSFNFTKPLSFVKSFFDSKFVLSVHNHLPMWYSFTAGFTHDIELEHAQMNHYRPECSSGVDCEAFKNNTIQDRTMWPFKNQMIPRVTKVLRLLKLI